MPRNTQHPLASVRHLALEGGGVKGLAYVEPLRALDNALPDGLASLETLAGTSAGAITAAIIAAGASFEQIDGLVRSTPWAKFADDRPGILRDLWRLWARGGWHRTKYARSWLRSAFEQVGRSPDVTFRELEARGKTLWIPATNETRGELTIFGRDPGTKTVPVVDAVLASMAIPFFFTRVEIGGSKFSDGGLLNNHPIDLLTRHQPSAVLGLRLDDPSGLDRRAPWWSRLPVFGRVAWLLLVSQHHANSRPIPPGYGDRVVGIQVDPDKVRATDFNLTDDQRRHLNGAGFGAMRRWILAHEAAGG